MFKNIFKAINNTIDIINSVAHAGSYLGFLLIILCSITAFSTKIFGKLINIINK